MIVYDVANMPELTDLYLEDDVPWITFYNEKTGIGFAAIHLNYSNAGIENTPRLLTCRQGSGMKGSKEMKIKSV